MASEDLNEGDPIQLLLDSSERFNTLYGQFMITYAQTEGALYRLLLRTAGVNDAVGRAIFSGIRAKLMTDYIANILENTSANEVIATELTTLFTQLKAINTMRDTLAHHAVPTYFMDGINTSTALRQNRYGKIKTIRVTHDMLVSMCGDLGKITYHFARHSRATYAPPDPQDWPPTWLYKSPQPEESQGRTRA